MAKPLIQVKRLDMTAKTLLAFDFDHTILDGNSDVEVQKLHSQPLPDEITKLYSGHDWNHYMAAIFALLHSNNVKPMDIEDNILSIPLVDGMLELFEYLKQDSFEVIIISDANDQFIKWHLQKHNLNQVVDKVYSNPAEFDTYGKLTLQYYHQQDWCKLCSKNLCKGYVLENHIKEKEATGTKYSKICYIGDGHNDFCPTLKLSAKDYVFPRIGYNLERRIKKSSEVTAQVVSWKGGSTILQTIKQSQ